MYTCAHVHTPSFSSSQPFSPVAKLSTTKSAGRGLMAHPLLKTETPCRAPPWQTSFSGSSRSPHPRSPTYPLSCGELSWRTGHPKEYPYLWVQGRKADPRAVSNFYPYPHGSLHSRHRPRGGPPPTELWIFHQLNGVRLARGGSALMSVEE